MKILKLAVILTFIVFLYSCNGNNSEINSNTIVNTIKIEKKIIERDTLIDNPNFQNFWLGFREIVLSKEYKKISEIITLPLEVYGFEDSDPRLNLSDIDSINMIFKVFLSDTHVNDFPNNYELIKNITNLEEFPGYSASAYLRSVEHMEFKKDGNKWRLSRIYLDTKNLKKEKR